MCQVATTVKITNIVTEFEARIRLEVFVGICIYF